MRSQTRKEKLRHKANDRKTKVQGEKMQKMNIKMKSLEARLAALENRGNN
jgi:hypothetical protein